MRPKRVTVAGHPFAPIGMGEAARESFRALRAVGVDAKLRDVYGVDAAADPDVYGELRPHVVPRLDSDVTIFVLNGDEREPVFRHLGADIGGAGYRIVLPMWELPRYPDVWARELEQYDEVWAASLYSRDSFAAAVRRPVIHLPLPCQPRLAHWYSRRHFGIPETSYVFVLFFDFTSYIDRKNPFGALDAFARLRQARPTADVQLAIKIGNKDANATAHARFLDALEPHRRHVVLIDRQLAHDEAKSLVAVGDALVSLHRSEGFGFGPAQAMYFGKPVVATAYSGNMDFMTPETSLFVPYSLVPVREGQYPHHAGQEWADPDVEQASRRMIELVDDPEAGRRIGARASAHVRTHFSLRATGLRYTRRLDQIPSVASGRGSGLIEREALEELDRMARSRPADEVYAALRRFSLQQIGELLLEVPERYGALGQVLPRMASPEVQMNWTGSTGAPLLAQSIAFVQTVSSQYASLAGRPLDGARILDYGCGWGRLIRLMYKFSGPDRIHGCDAWEHSLDLCRTHGVRAQLALCEEVPREVPFPGVTFDLAYAFSVFTHLSERTARAVSDVLRRCIDPRGLVVITIRPVEYWNVHPRHHSKADVAQMRVDHAARGFAFTPHDRAPIDGEVTYGDTSISIEYIERNWPGWTVGHHVINPVDPCQELVFLRPV